MIKTQLAELLHSALLNAREAGDLALNSIPSITLDMPKNRAHGDWTTNVALAMAPGLGIKARDAAERLLRHLPIGRSVIASAEIAGPGFINLRLKPDWLYDILRQIEADGDSYGHNRQGDGKRVILEFVSANPNGPITVAHGRNAAIGDALAALLKATGNNVYCEHYINDALNSTQMNNFGRSVFYFYRQLLGHSDDSSSTTEHDWLYRGDYVVDIARTVIALKGSEYEDADIDDPDVLQAFRELAQSGMTQQQQLDLAAFGVTFDNWFHESELHADGRVAAAIEEMTRNGHTYEKDGALWLRSTDFGDDKDRVLMRANGTATYIAGDCAYHKDKFDRGYDRAIDVWGADHAGYIARTKASIAALGYDPMRLDVLLYQLVRIMKDGEFVKSSKRKGNFLELKADLIDEIGKDAARFYFLMRSPNTDLDIDLNLAIKTEKDNPVYYVQYAHARISQTMEKAREVHGLIDHGVGSANLALLSQESEVELIKKLSDFPDEVGTAAREFAPQRIAQYARDLAAQFHGFYDSGNRNASLRVVGDDIPLTTARLALINCARIVLKNALTLLGVSAPERM